jgi:hypothetical protein
VCRVQGAGMEGTWHRVQSLGHRACGLDLGFGV